jgi:lipid-A-disaccharide synthase-like uncharacterized protein
MSVPKRLYVYREAFHVLAEPRGEPLFERCVRTCFLSRMPGRPESRRHEHPDSTAERRRHHMGNEQFWLLVGFGGQAFFTMRFVVQWIASERRKESVIPVAFWFFSIGGGLTLFTYALHRLDPVFILGEGAGVLIYSRNLYLIWRKRQSDA